MVITDASAPSGSIVTVTTLWMVGSGHVDNRQASLSKRDNDVAERVRARPGELNHE